MINVRKNTRIKIKFVTANGNKGKANSARKSNVVVKCSHLALLLLSGKMLLNLIIYESLELISKPFGAERLNVVFKIIKKKCCVP